MVTLKEDYNKLMTENAILTQRIGKFESLRNVKTQLENKHPNV
jgi:hypothetical protein